MLRVDAPERCGSRSSAATALCSLSLEIPLWANPDELTARASRLFDLSADPRAIARVLSKDPLLAPLVARRPGLRVPGAWDPFEVAVRAVLGQQISVAGARTLAGRLVALCGRPLPKGLARPGLTHVFPSPAAVAEADVARVGLPRARAASLQGVRARRRGRSRSSSRRRAASTTSRNA